MSEQSTYLVTGAGRGIGLGLAEAILQKPGVTLIAAVRDVAKATSALEVIPKAEGSSLIIVKIDSQNDSDPAAAAKQLGEEHGITSIDVIIANAGIAHSGAPVSKASPDALREHHNVNSVAPIILFQAFLPLLKASKNPVFIPISTSVASVALLEHLTKIFPPVLAPYGASKAALNYLVTRLHFEETWLTTFVVHPGLVVTEMGSGLISTSEDAASLGAIDVPTSAAGLFKLASEATREKYGGSFRNWDGTTVPW